MLKIGNIISEIELVSHAKVDYINYYCEGNKPVYDQNLPTLVIGREFFKKWYNPNQNILQKEVLPNKLYWDYWMPESMSGYFTGLEKFINNLPNYFINNFEYQSIDAFDVEPTDLDKILKLFDWNNKSTAYQYKDEMIYIHTKNTITGIYLVSFDYFNYDVLRIIKLIKDNINTYHDTDGSSYINYYKKFPEFGNLKRSMPIFHFS